MTDHDDWAKEDCGCGHPRHAHHFPDGPCTRTVMRTDYSSLPVPVYDPRLEDSVGDLEPYSWPTNWPAPNSMPKSERPCACIQWHQPEQAEPDWGAA